MRPADSADAPVGYGLPIGGALATHEAVIPYAEGVDIACRMRLSVYPVSPHALGPRRNDFRRSLLERTRFGQSETWERGAWLISRPAFRQRQRRNNLRRRCRGWMVARTPTD